SLFNPIDNGSSVGPSDVQANNGISIRISVFTAIDGGSVTVDASASNGGQTGKNSAHNPHRQNEIYLYDQIHNPIPPSSTAYVQNQNAFTGGQDASNYTYVQQQDIDGATNPLIAQLTSDAQQQAQQQLQPGEQLVQAITCSSSINPDHQVQAI